MDRNAYRKPPEAVDMAQEERGIRLSTTLAGLLTIAAYAGAYALVPRITDLPTDLAERLAFAAQCWAILGFNLLVAIMMVSTARRFSPHDIGGQAAGPPSEALAIKAAFL